MAVSLHLRPPAHRRLLRLACALGCNFCAAQQGTLTDGAHRSRDAAASFSSWSRPIIVDALLRLITLVKAYAGTVSQYAYALRGRNLHTPLTVSSACDTQTKRCTRLNGRNSDRHLRRARQRVVKVRGDLVWPLPICAARCLLLKHMRAETRLTGITLRSQTSEHHFAPPSW